MKKILVSLSGLMLLTIIIAGCTPVPTPDVEITGTNFNLGVSVDSTDAFTSPHYYAILTDNTLLTVRNYVDIVVDGAYGKINQVTGVGPDSAIFIRMGEVLGFTSQYIPAGDTLYITGLTMEVTDEAQKLWTDQSIKSYRLDFHFVGEDGYGKHKRFDVCRSVTLFRF